MCYNLTHRHLRSCRCLCESRSSMRTIGGADPRMNTEYKACAHFILFMVVQHRLFPCSLRLTIHSKIDSIYQAIKVIDCDFLNRLNTSDSLLCSRYPVNALTLLKTMMTENRFGRRYDSLVVPYKLSLYGSSGGG